MRKLSTLLIPKNLNQLANAPKSSAFNCPSSSFFRQPSQVNDVRPGSGSCQHQMVTGESVWISRIEPECRMTSDIIYSKFEWACECEFVCVCAREWKSKLFPAVFSLAGTATGIIEFRRMNQNKKEWNRDKGFFLLFFCVRKVQLSDQI